MSTLVTILVLLVYAGGGIKFWSGFAQTNFSQNKLFLSLMWPVLIFNRNYRGNFIRALKG
ncbi:hypothetical protein [Lyngbya confervoides]|uniref:Uncharacterized protein n=1 Tax=Lyngbya confervoides BDU141951 TaxID=1574623 RepID=A0ABD4T2Y6_9CYAN|nr:hypothetical protein [Lyngbya confervoides]MCM1982751.1 hypothetical protein [Lyngbya confervoides BDU141951]